jgi:hypothetical protein
MLSFATASPSSDEFGARIARFCGRWYESFSQPALAAGFPHPIFSATHSLQANYFIELLP